MSSGMKYSLQIQMVISLFKERREVGEKKLAYAS